MTRGLTLAGCVLLGAALGLAVRTQIRDEVAPLLGAAIALGAVALVAAMAIRRRSG